MSFLDDCFFYPSESSEDYQLILDMVRRRDQPLSCWLDHQEYLRYTDTNSYLFNRKGDRVKLTTQEIDELKGLKLLIIV